MSQPIAFIIAFCAGCALEPLSVMAQDKPAGGKAGVDWPGFLGPLGTGITSEKGLKPWKPGGLPTLWSIRLGEGYAAPIIYQQRCIVFDRIENQLRCRSLDAATAQEQWVYEYPCTYTDKYNYDGGPRACPVTDGERIYLHGPDGMLHCITLATGKLVWKCDTLATFGVVQNFFGVGSTPLLEGDKLLVHVGGSPPGSDNKPFDQVTSNHSAIVAFDKLTGKVLYQCGNDLASYASPQVVMLGGKRVGLIFARGGLLGFDPTLGKDLFYYPFRARMLESVNVSNAVVHQDQILICEAYAAGSTLLRYQNQKLEPVWTAVPRRQEQGLGTHMNTPILLDGYVYGCAGRHPSEADLRCIEWNTGKVAWRATPKLGDYQAGRGTLTCADQHLLYLAEEGVLFLLKANPQRCEELAVWDGRQPAANGPPLPMLPEPSWAAPVVSHGRIYLRGRGKLVCLDGYVAE